MCRSLWRRPRCSARVARTEPRNPSVLRLAPSRLRRHWYTHGNPLSVLLRMLGTSLPVGAAEAAAVDVGREAGGLPVTPRVTRQEGPCRAAPHRARSTWL